MSRPQEYVVNLNSPLAFRCDPDVIARLAEGGPLLEGALIQPRKRVFPAANPDSK